MQPPDVPPSGEPHDASAKRQRWWTLNLPYAAWWPLAAGALVGLMLRLIYSGKPDQAYSAMSGAFIFLAPMLVGAVSVYVAETKERRSWGYYAAMPVGANVLFVAGTMALMIEGLICAVIILPLFCVLGAVGGLVMGAVCRFTNWPRPAVYSLAVLPLILAPAIHTELPSRPLSSVSRSIDVPGPPSAVWPHLLTATHIRPEEVAEAWMYRIGVPLPESGITALEAGRLVRHVKMGKSIQFDQVSSDWRGNEYVRWQYQFNADSFPPQALDDHVVIGGRFFDLVDTLYSLEATGTESTRLTIQMSYRVSTQFNWYADAIAQVLIGDFEEVILAFYRDRSVRDRTAGR